MPDLASVLLFARVPRSQAQINAHRGQQEGQPKRSSVICRHHSGEKHHACDKIDHCRTSLYDIVTASRSDCIVDVNFQGLKR